MKLDKLQSNILNLFTPELDDPDLCSLRATCRFLRNNAGSNATSSDFLCRSQVRGFKLIPTYLIERILRPQPPWVIEAFLELLPAIQSGLRKVMSHEAHAEWILFALLNLPNKVRVFLGDAITTTTDDTGYFVYHYYALGGHWDTFKEHMDTYYPGFTFDINNACYNEIGRKVMLGGHIAFYNNLVKHYKFPDYTQDSDEAWFLLPSAIASGKLAVVETLTAMRADNPPSDEPTEPLFEFDYLANAIRLGHDDIFEHLTAGNQPFCAVRTPEEAAEVFTTAAQFDNVDRVKYFLEDPQAIEKWGFDLSTSDEGETVCSRALIGCGKKVLDYLLTKDTHILLKPKDSEMPALLIAAEHKQTEMCSLLIKKYNIDPLTHTDKGRYSIHYAAIGGNYDCYRWLARDFADNKLLASVDGKTPLHFAAEHGRYWFLKEALIDFGPTAFLAKTENDETLLHYAFRSGNLHIIDLLLKERILSLDDRDKDGNTPLHHYLLWATDPTKRKIFITELVQKYGTEIFHIPGAFEETVYDLLTPEYKEIVDAHTTTLTI